MCAKKEEYILLMFQSITQLVEKKLLFQRFQMENDMQQYMALSCSKKLSALITGITSKIMMIFMVWIVFVPVEWKTNLNHMKKYVKMRFKIFTTRASKHIPSGFSMSIISLFKIMQNKHEVYRGKDCMKKSLR